MSAVLAGLLAVLPGLYAWGSGRRVARHLESPVFDQLWARYRTWVTFALVATVALGFTLGALRGLVVAAVAIAGTAAGRWATRRQVFEEDWSFAGYLGVNARVLVGVLGRLLLVGALPLVMIRSGPLAVPAAVALGTLILLWHLLDHRILPRLLGAVRLEDPDLLMRFSAVDARARCGPPLVYRLPSRGGRWANGLAVPGATGAAVILTDSLLETLAPEETTAIYSHEVAHLEHRDTAWVAGKVAVNGVALAAAAVTVLVLGPDSQGTRVFAWVWPVLYVLGALVAGSRVQSEERMSDARAAELCGDPGSLERALERVYALNRFPRRRSLAHEEGSSHPSLARRIQAIRSAAAGADSGREAGPEAAAPAEGTLVVASPGSGDVLLLLGPERLELLRGVPPEARSDVEEARRGAADLRSLRYGEIVELRVHARSPRSIHLVVVDRAGRRERVPLDRGDVAAVQARLDSVDSLLGPAPPAADRTRAITLVAAALLALAGVSLLGRWILAVAAVVVVLWPTAFALVAAGATGLGEIGLAAGGLGAWTAGPVLYPPLVPFAVVVASGALLAVGLRRRLAGVAEPAGPLRWGVTTFVAVAALGTAGGLVGAFGPLPAMRLHLWTSGGPEALTVLAGAAAGLLVLRSRGARLAGFLGMALAAGLAGSATSEFRERFTRDSFRAVPPALPVVPGHLVPVREVDVPEPVHGLRLAPAGGRFAAELPSGLGPPGAVREFLVEGAERRVAALDLEWTDAETLVTLVGTRDGLAVATGAADPAAGVASVEVALPRAPNPRLRVNRELGRWSVWGWSPLDRHAVLLTGELGRPEFDRSSPGLEAVGTGFLSLLPAERAALLVEHADLPGASGLSILPSRIRGASVVTRLWIVDGGGTRLSGRTARSVTCVQPPGFGGSRFACLAMGAATTEIWIVDPEAEGPEPMGTVDGSYYDATLAGPDELVLQAYGERTLLVDLRGGLAHELRDPDPPPSGAAWEHLLSSWIDPGSGLLPTAFAFNAGVLAVALGGEEAGGVRVYRLVR